MVKLTILGGATAGTISAKLNSLISTLNTVNTNVTYINNRVPSNLSSTLSTINSNVSTINTNAANANTNAANAYNAINDFVHRNKVRKINIYSGSGMTGTYYYHVYSGIYPTSFSYNNSDNVSVSSSVNTKRYYSGITLDLSNVLDDEIKNIISNGYGYYINWAQYNIQYKMADNQEAAEAITSYTNKIYKNRMVSATQDEFNLSFGLVDFYYINKKYKLALKVGESQGTTAFSKYFIIGSLYFDFEIFY